MLDEKGVAWPGNTLTFSRSSFMFIYNKIKVLQDQNFFVTFLLKQYLIIIIENAMIVLQIPVKSHTTS